MFETFLLGGCKSKKFWYYIIYICWKIIDSIGLIVVAEVHKYVNCNYVIICVLCIRERYNISVSTRVYRFLHVRTIYRV